MKTIEDTVYSFSERITKPLMNTTAMPPAKIIDIMVEEYLLTIEQDSDFTQEIEKHGIAHNDVLECIRRALIRSLNTK